MTRLKFSSSKSNNKLNKLDDAKYAYTFSLPAGHACPFALSCKASVNDKGKIVRGPEMKYQCFGASAEIRSKALRRNSKDNFDLLKSVGLHEAHKLSQLIIKSIPADARRVRIHTTGGDYVSADYMKAWMMTADMYDDVLFYGYTKAIKHLALLQPHFPDNLKIVASRGGTQDHVIDEHNLVEAVVVYHPDEAKELGLEIDHDDTLCMKADKSFALLLHGQQASGSDASKALQRMRKEEVSYSYG